MLQKENEKQHTNLFGNLLNNKKDFINGSMGVGLDKWNPAKAEILKLIETENYDGFIYTQDWHPENHCSFKEQNGIKSLLSLSIL